MASDLPVLETVHCEPIWFQHYLTHVRLDKEATGGEFALIEMHAASFASPPHIHHNESESFYVIEGQLEVHKEGRAFTLGSGDAIHTPRGVPHMYKVVSDTARWLVLVSPAGFEGLMRRVSRPAESNTIPPGFAGRIMPLPSTDSLAAGGIEILGAEGELPPEL
ncbi:cupin domain-containing protein [Streptomyces sp. NPDC051219]|uniref:cupin domain-containing protein n=1 Tax=Streptomyces sp. NPDC051219 TaxID=3155283 RepID=UPI003442B5D2